MQIMSDFVDSEVFRLGEGASRGREGFFFEKETNFVAAV